MKPFSYLKFFSVLSVSSVLKKNSVPLCLCGDKSIFYGTVAETHGSNSSATDERREPSPALLPGLRARSGRSTHLRRLLGRNLPPLRYAAGNA